VFSEDRELYIGRAEAIAGVGLMVGPVIGGFLFTAFDYFFTFFIFSLILAINLIVSIVITPSSLNQSVSSEEQ
jgi:MFS family permease